MSWTPPSPEDLERELERVRAAEPPAPGRAAPSLREHLIKGALRTVLLWLLLVLVFLAVWHFLN